MDVKYVYIVGVGRHSRPIGTFDNLEDAVDKANFYLKMDSMTQQRFTVGFVEEDMKTHGAGVPDIYYYHYARIMDISGNYESIAEIMRFQLNK